MDEKELKFHSGLVALGKKASRFLESEEWKEIVKPLFDLTKKKLSDITEIDLENISQEEIKAEVLARKLALAYISDMENALIEYIVNGEFSGKRLESLNKQTDLYQIKKDK